MNEVSEDLQEEVDCSAPRAAVVVSIYHFFCFAASGFAVTFVYFWCPDLTNGLKLIAYSLAFGAMGGTLRAARYVVWAVRKCIYQRNRILWQVSTPVYSAALAAIGLVLINGGVMTLTQGPKGGPTYVHFLMGVSFVIGYVSEVFIKRLIAASEALFGEQHEFDEENDPRG